MADGALMAIGTPLEIVADGVLMDEFKSAVCWKKRIQGLCQSRGKMSNISHI